MLDGNHHFAKFCRTRDSSFTETCFFTVKFGAVQDRNHFGDDAGQVAPEG